MNTIGLIDCNTNGTDSKFFGSCGTDSRSLVGTHVKISLQQKIGALEDKLRVLLHFLENEGDLGAESSVDSGGRTVDVTLQKKGKLRIAI